jgi:DNA repair protein RecN (Recombination protein N)
MLKRLSVQNYILIDQLDITLGKGLTIITGETGAGKSIILGALGLMLGQRADANLLMNKEKKCIVEGTFDVSAYGLEEFFQAHELDFDRETTIRREINPEGKSRAFVNDTPVGLQVLKELAAQLVDIHSQHETLLLGNSRFQLNVVDAYAANKKILDSYKAAFSTYKSLQKELAELIDAEQKSKGDLDYLQFQFNELAALNLQSGEQIQLEQEQEKLEHAEEILSQLAKATTGLQGGEENIVSELIAVQHIVQSLRKYDEQFESLSARIQAAIVELKDVYDELDKAADDLQVDPARLEWINDRLSALYQLQKKHRLTTVDELLVLQNDLEQKMLKIGSLEEEIEKKQAALKEGLITLKKVADELSASRKKAIPGIEKEINKQLNELAMPHAVLRIAQQPVDDKDTFLADGQERIQFLFSANKGMDFKELAKVASGGEMSRLMLSIKSLLARLSEMPTIIFDEIDTGISGETAARVGSILKSMAKEHQVLAITHLPQMASKGDAHFLVYKETKKSSTRSFLRELNEEERVNEIARMLSGEELTAAALENARDLLGQ